MDTGQTDTQTDRYKDTHTHTQTHTDACRIMPLTWARVLSGSLGGMGRAVNMVTWIQDRQTYREKDI